MSKKPYKLHRIPDQSGWYKVFDLDGNLRAFAERAPSWWRFYYASDSGNPQGASVRYERLHDGADAYTNPRRTTF